MEPSFGEHFGLCLIDYVDSQPIIIFKEVFFGLVWNWVISGFFPFIRIGENNSLQFLIVHEVYEIFICLFTCYQ